MGSRWKIVSGGQTGVDRAALDAARALGLAYGGFVPKGRRTEDGALPADYEGMTELASPRYRVRTIRNLSEADATLVLTRGDPDRGTRLTLETAKSRGKPHLVVDLADSDPAEAAARIRTWLAALPAGTLNVAGPRESGKPGIHAEARALLVAALGPWSAGPNEGPD